MSYIASALAVELLVSVLQHPDKGLAPADTSANDDHLTVEHISPLGIVPHQVGDWCKRSKISNTSCLPKRPRQTVQTQIRLLLKKQSDQGLPCLLF